MTTILDYNEYAKLAAAAYVQLEDEPSLTGDRIAFQANEQSRIPIALANQMFDSGPTSWTIPAAFVQRQRAPGHDGGRIMIVRTARWESAARYYELYEGEDLFGQPIMVKVWGGKGSGRGGSRTLTEAAAAFERTRQEVSARRRRHGYLEMPVD